MTLIMQIVGKSVTADTPEAVLHGVRRLRYLRAVPWPSHLAPGPGLVTQGNLLAIHLDQTPSGFTGKSQVGERVRSENTDRVHIMTMSTPQGRTESVERESRQINAVCTVSVAAS
ncbi:hypothetical protein [Streptomyces mirabilis]|uniref:hypothetical protein n=1 Tax=Streptomyces mirabilis TaxID=68239 RepID=UPI0036A31E76